MDLERWDLGSSRDSRDLGFGWICMNTKPSREGEDRIAVSDQQLSFLWNTMWTERNLGGAENEPRWGRK